MSNGCFDSEWPDCNYWNEEGDIKECLQNAPKCSALNDLPQPKGKTRTFESGATRDSDANKIDYEGFLSPLVLEEFGKYMNKNRIQSDGTTRDSDNWQKGIPQEAYMKSLWRHFMDVWLFHRKGTPRESIHDALCGVMFNAMGMLHEILREERRTMDAYNLEMFGRIDE